MLADRLGARREDRASGQMIETDTIVTAVPNEVIALMTKAHLRRAHHLAGNVGLGCPSFAQHFPPFKPKLLGVEVIAPHRGGELCHPEQGRCPTRRCTHGACDLRGPP